MASILPLLALRHCKGVKNMDKGSICLADRLGAAAPRVAMEHARPPLEGLGKRIKRLVSRWTRAPSFCLADLLKLQKKPPTSTSRASWRSTQVEVAQKENKVEQKLKVRSGPLPVSGSCGGLS